MIDRSARDRLIERVQWILDGEATVQSVANEPSASEDRAVLEVEERLIANRCRLPLSPGDDLSALSPQGREEMERAILLLRTDLEFEPAPMGHMGWVMFAGMTIYVTGAVIDMIAQDRLIPAVANPLHYVTAIAGAVLVLPLVVSYLMSLGWAARHIYLVRIRRRMVTDVDVRCQWPFASQEQMRQAKSLHAAGGLIVR